MPAGMEIKVTFPNLDSIKEAFRQLPPKLSAKAEGTALKKAIDPGYKALLANVRQMNQVSGNLLRAVSVKRKGYKRTGSAVALAGFIVAGSDKKASSKVQAKGRDKAYHQGFLEFGTKERRTKGRIASSFRKRGAFSFAKGVFDVATRTRSKRVATNPQYPKAFFKAVRRGGTVSLGKMPVGGSTGKPPVRDAYESSLASMKALTESEMRNALLAIHKNMGRQFPVLKNAGK